MTGTFRWGSALPRGTMGAMTGWTPLILSAFGLALLCVEFWATRLNRKTFHDLPRRTWLVYAICTCVAGVVLAYGSLYLEYHPRPGVRYFGVPFMTAAWRFERGRWIDYIGVLALPALLGNALAAFLLPEIFVPGARGVCRKSKYKETFQ
jgi:hypothetical protein